MDGQTESAFNTVFLIVAAVLAVLLVALVSTWRLRILSFGVEVRCLFIRRTWNWGEFKHAEVGLRHYQVYFRQFPLWKRVLSCESLENVIGEKIWGILLEHIPPSEKWVGPLRVSAEPWATLTFVDDGITIRRYFRERFYSWDTLERAVIFQSVRSGQGFIKLNLVFGKRTYSFINVLSRSGGRKRPADYDVVEFLIDHVPEEKLVFCTPSGPPRSMAEFEERKKALHKEERDYVLMCLQVIVMALIYSCWVLYFIIRDGEIGFGYWGVVAVFAGLFPLLFLLVVVYLVFVLRDMFKAERQLNADRDALLN